MHRKFWVGTLAVALLVSLGWGLNEYRLAGEYRLASENNNRRALTDFASHLDQLETDMAKGNVANSPNQQVFYLSQVSSKSDGALKDFAQIPAEQAGLSYIGQFLTQSGDFARTLAQKVASGGTISADDEKNLQEIHDRLVPVNEKVQTIMTRMDTENLAWTDPAPSLWKRLGLGGPQIAEASADGSEAASKSVRSGLDQLDVSLQKLPPFSYTGEFSARVVEKPLGLPAGQVSRAQAQSTAQSFLNKVGYTNVKPDFAGESKGDLGGYSWQYKDAYLEVSRQGGVVTFYQNQRPIDPRTLSLDDAAKKAQAALQTLGWKLAITSNEDFGSYVKFEAVAEQDGVRLYPDKVRLAIAMDNGQLISLDATPYYAFHHARTFPAKIAMDQAARKLRPNFKVLESRLAVIAKPGNQEVYAYEFLGRYLDEEYLLYLNAQTGNEEKIQRVIKTPRGEYLQ
ncbi:germination protein YpeB [Desulfosporosinus sp. PR]|uniref:PepSY1/2 domain-containing protein n=1 Tax=Candidatus Desulfosporosinus nitrosoreducens TaxID=3401928 RepID=UPI0027FEC5D6|nr:PepSY1/2 domain-containing protein [Desulfosporosinus sp. PR]MDQ7092999.1 germination protein YpeB [Desulfosporosinus sp. PR]